MKIAQINNIAGVGSILAEQQRKEGHEVEVFVFNEIAYKQFGGRKFNYYSPFDRWKIFRILKKYDIWHYHYPYGSLKRKLDKEHSNSKVYLKHYHGNDLRKSQDDDFCLVATPDLLKYAPNAKWVPTPIDLKEIKFTAAPSKFEKNDVAKVAHYPYFRNYSSVDYYSDTLNALEKEQRCKVVRVINQPHLEVLRILNNCDIVVGKIASDLGWFGKFELEGMALGKPVITHVAEELYSQYNPPIYRTSKDTFKRDLETLIEDNSERSRLSKEGREYIMKNHSAETVSKTVMQSYKICNN